MGRPTKTGLDYFPLDVNIDDNLELIEAEHGLQGYAIVIKLWQKIYANGYYIEWNEDVAMLFARKLNTDLSVVNAVVNACLRRSLFDSGLNKKYGILTSPGIQKRYISICSQSKRKSIIIYSEFKLVNSEFTELITELIPFTIEESAQSKVKQSKVKESKVIYSIFYDEQIEKTNDETYIKFVKFLFGENDLNRKLKKVLSWGDQIDFERFTKLLKLTTEHGKKLRDVVLDMETKTYKYDSFYRALTNWIKK